MEKQEEENEEEPNKSLIDDEEEEEKEEVQVKEELEEPQPLISTGDLLVSFICIFALTIYYI